MYELSNSTMFWAAVVAAIILAAVVINFIMGGLVNARGLEQARHRHRISNQLPRALTSNRRDEVLDLEDDADRR